MVWLLSGDFRMPGVLGLRELKWSRVWLGKWGVARFCSPLLPSLDYVGSFVWVWVWRYWVVVHELVPGRWFEAMLP